MENYDTLGLVGEGSYGVVLKCVSRSTGRLVAIKKFLDFNESPLVRRIADREIRMLRLLKHQNLVHLLDTFLQNKYMFLVFEFVDHTVLDVLKKWAGGVSEQAGRDILRQVVAGTEFCHSRNIVHRDIKPENVLVSNKGLVKICDFGFARMLTRPGEVYTEYVATRWYRAPELLVGDVKYGRAVDVWAIGCLLAEMMDGAPLFPGDSDIDQLFIIMQCLGQLMARQKEVFYRNPVFLGMKIPKSQRVMSLEARFCHVSPGCLQIMENCLQINPEKRASCSELLRHDWLRAEGLDLKSMEVA